MRSHMIDTGYVRIQCKYSGVAREGAQGAGASPHKL